MRSTTTAAPSRSGEDSPATFFFQVRRPGGATAADVSYGVGAVPGFNFDFEAFDAQFRITGQGNVSARNGGAFSGTLATLDADEFFNVYLVVDTAADAYDIYLTEAADSAADASDLIADDFALRSPGTISAFLGITGQSTGLTQIDNLFVDADGVNLSNPVPEPGTAALGLAGAAMLLRRRRTA